MGTAFFQRLDASILSEGDDNDYGNSCIMHRCRHVCWWSDVAYHKCSVWIISNSGNAVGGIWQHLDCRWACADGNGEIVRERTLN